MTYYELTRCVCCESKNLGLTLDLGSQPLANDFRPVGSGECELYPLALMTCFNCWHSQLSHCVERELIFANYAYVSGTSNTLSRYFCWFAESLAKCLEHGSRILDIAANDGSLVEALESQGFDVVGIDPAKNVVTDALKKGRHLIEGYWPRDANRLARGFDAIICMNVLAHVDNPREFLRTCEEYLNREGIVIIQSSQARMFGNGEFDTCYHEHISFFNSNSIRILGEAVGLRLVSVFFTKIHGDSCVYVFAKVGAKDLTDINTKFSRDEFFIDENVYEYENEIGLFDKQTYFKFELQSMNLINRFRERVSHYRENGFGIVFVGAAAKAMTIINAARVEPDLFLDEAPLKIGNLVPGCRLVVKDLQALCDVKRRVLVVITAWNFSREILEKLSVFNLPKGSVYYCYFPTESILPISDALTSC